MAETTYRRTPEGFMEPIIPQAAGKAAAATRFLAQGGGMTDKSGMLPGDKRTRGGQITRKGRVVKGANAGQIGERYTAGPQAGMTQAQAENEFEKRWQGASDAIKDKYATRARNSLAPSEQAAAAADKAKREGTSTTSAVPAMAPKTSAFTELTKPPVMPAGGMVSVGDGSTAENGWTPQPRPKSFGKGDFGYSFTDDMKTIGTSLKNAAVVSAGGNPTPATPAKPAMAPAASPAGYSPADARRDDEARVAAMRPGTPAVTPSSPAVSTPALPIAPTSPARATSDVAYSTLADQRMAEGYPAATAATPAMRSPRINPLTKLPMGYRPGDAVDPAQQSEADASVARQTAATAAVPVPRAIPVAAPVKSAPQRYSEAQESYQEHQLDPNKREEMRETYASATDLDKAKIVGSSMRRAGNLLTAAKPVRR